MPGDRSAPHSRPLRPWRSPRLRKEWRAQAALSGGGGLVDQGVHLIDLSRWFLVISSMSWGVRRLTSGTCKSMTTRSSAENCGRAMAQLHASWTEWKNLFSFEVFGRIGKLEITGLGGSYGEGACPLQDETRDGAARAFFLGVPRSGCIPGSRVRRVPERHSSRAPTFSRSR